MAFNKNHLKWIKDYKNALFSNDPNFYEEYLQCFSDNEDDKGKQSKILNLKEKIENKYKIKFNFNDKYLYFPNFKNEGNYSDLIFYIKIKFA